ncbi:MAG: hypothetical protein ABIK89_04820 [Planctomycetota bacterium]
MLDDDGGTLRAVAWTEIFPWLKLFRCFRLAIRLRLLLLSAVAILLTFSGWSVLGFVFSESDDAYIARQIEPYQGCPWQALTGLVPDKPCIPGLDASFGAQGPSRPFFNAETEADLPQLPRESQGAALTGPAPTSILTRARAPVLGTEPFLGTWEQFSLPFVEMFRSDVTVTRLVFLLLCGLWALAIWAFFGGAITRVAAVELAREERVGWGAMLHHARSKWRSYFGAPLLLLVFALPFALGMGIVGICLWWNAGLFLAGLLLWPLMLVGGLVMTYLLVWLAFGWPLMWATVSAEGEDSFDALSRSREYVFQRPLHYLFYVLVAVLFGWLGWLVVSNFAAGVIASTHWAADWGADTSQWLLGDGSGDRQIDLLLAEEAELGALGGVGAGLIHFWSACLKLLAVGFLYSYFWTASTCIYFLLRHDAQGTEMDEVFLDEEPDEPASGLPPLETDEAGAPVVADDTILPGRNLDRSTEP